MTTASQKGMSTDRFSRALSSDAFTCCQPQVRPGGSLYFMRKQVSTYTSLMYVFGPSRLNSWQSGFTHQVWTCRFSILFPQFLDNAHPNVFYQIVLRKISVSLESGNAAERGRWERIVLPPKENCLGPEISFKLLESKKRRNLIKNGNGIHVVNTAARLFARRMEKS